MMLKVRPVIERVNLNSRRHRNPERDLSIDEGVVAYRGRSKSVVYNPAKPHKYGLRVYTLSDTITGYVFDDEIHQTFTGDRHPLDTEPIDSRRVFIGHKPGQVVSRLMRKYYNRGHHLTMDSYYTSAALFDHLYINGTVATGTCKMQTEGLPDEIKRAKLYEPRCVPREDTTCQRWPQGSFTALQDGAMSVATWKGTKLLKFMSTAVNPRYDNHHHDYYQDGKEQVDRWS